MKGTPRSLWLSAANRAAGWWMGQATAMVRRQQRAALAEMGRAAEAAQPGAKPKTKAKTKTKTKPASKPRAAPKRRRPAPR